MTNRAMFCVRWLTLALVLLFANAPASAQFVNAGLKGGFNISWTHSDDADFRNHYNTSPVAGYNAGAAFSFQLKKRYFLHTEILYSTKGRIVEGDLALKDKAIHKYVEIPIMYQIHFKGSISSKGMKQFKWYAGIGPNFSYWLGGKGTMTHFEITDHDVPEIPYEIRFGERPSEHIGESEFVFVREARRIQLGMNIGGGVVVEPADNRKFVVDVRFELGHSWLGGAESADYVFPTTYSTNMQARNMGLRLSIMYMLQTNLDKKERNKGKRGVLQQGKTIKRRN